MNYSKEKLSINKGNSFVLSKNGRLYDCKVLDVKFNQNQVIVFYKINDNSGYVDLESFRYMIEEHLVLCVN